MLEKLEQLKIKWEEIGRDLGNPEVIRDMKRYTDLNREYKQLQPLAEAYDNYKNILSNIESAKQVLDEENDEEFREMASLEIEDLKAQQTELEEHLKTLLTPKDPDDHKNCILEIRAGTGGDEASIFAGDLYRMYNMFCDTKGLKLELLNSNEGTSGGFKEICLNVIGDEAYAILKFESGVHRVQRVPTTETQGRVHTSAASVVVLPEAEEVDVDLNEKDIRRDTFRASGAGGQHVNKTESAIRLTHLPTGIVVECQDGRSQHKNLEKAMTVLRSRLYEKELMEKNAEIAGKRKVLVSTGDRSAKIRTYNYPQGRVTDHRINLTLYDLNNIMNGNIDKIIEALKVADTAEKMKEESL
jgi:peptide chain release factor 1